ncbi:hypothetical protein TGRUB_314482 [Toxoplasma gondii RUB]|uniref:Uncharacterized protein n=1 Tax=Toxoplasma gondii RUB TaxID=935652 RepID=A0A086MBH4_TOXGO|nr:hypothetical protein TGRUB_314482 [Toxoplasma gondii RUB]
MYWCFHVAKASTNETLCVQAFNVQTVHSFVLCAGRRSSTADRASGAALRGTQALAYNPAMQYGNENMRLAPGSMPAAPVVMRPVVAPLIQGTFWRVHNGLAAASNSLLGTGKDPVGTHTPCQTTRIRN